MTDPATTPYTSPPTAAQPSGIGGWLILPMLGLFASIAIQLIGLTDAGSTFAALLNLSPIQSNVVQAEFFLNLILFLALPIGLLVLFFNKDRKFPRFYIWWVALGAIFVFVDLVVGYALFRDIYEQTGTPFFDRDTLRSIGGALAGVCIWIPYMLNSVRVKNTFVN